MFCLKHGLVTPATPLLPTKEVTLIYFVSHLAKYVRFHTIKVYLAAIQNLHVEFNCNLNFAVMPRLQNTLRGIKRTLGLSRRNRLPITLFILESIFKLLTPSHSLDIDTVMLWAAFSLAFFGFLRCSELTCNGQFDRNVHLTREDFAFFPNIVSPQHMKVRIKSLRPTHAGKLQLSPSPVLNPTSVPWLPQEISSSKHPTAPRKAPCSSLRMAPLSHDVPRSRTYTPYLSCVAFNLITTTLTVSELGQPRQQLPLAYPRGLSRFLAAGALTPMKGTFTSLKLPYCKYRLLWLPTTRTTLELRT